MRVGPDAGAGRRLPLLHERAPLLLTVALALFIATGARPVASGYSPAVEAAGPSAGLSAGTDPLIAAAGDIACDPASSGFNGGLGTSGSCRMKYTSDLLVSAGLAAVLDLGDNQYYCGGYTAFQQSYDLSWGRLKSITFPSVGNHEYLISGGTGCDTTGKAKGYFQYFGSAAGDPAKGYYSFDVGSWHLIALNTQCGQVGGCGSGSPQAQWLQADLAAHSNICTLAFWHIPLYSSGGRATTGSRYLWQLLYAANADLVLTGHDHTYERFAPQDPFSNLDTARGLREFVVGTGGADHTSFTTIFANSEVRDANTFGVLELALHPTSYDWSFVPEAGKTFTDSGTTFCHTATAPPAGTMTGTVTDLLTGLPVAGVTLSYSGGSVTTSATGAYTFSAVRVGTYTSQGTYGVRVAAGGYAIQTQTITVISGATTNQNIALVPMTGAIKGVVTDASTAAPIAGASVSYVVKGVTTSAITNSTGTYILANVPPGSYNLAASANNYTSSTPVTVTVGPGAAATQNFSLAPLRGTISGTVTDSVTAKAIANATVAYSGGLTTSNASGAYSLTGVTAGTYSVTASASRYSSQSQTVAVGPGAATIQNFSLAPVPGSISGTVTDSGTGSAIAGATVAYSGGSTTTNGSGVYTLAGVVEGSYSVTASAANYASGAPVSVTVGPGAAATQSFSLAPLPGSIGGQVTDAVTGKAIAAATVSYSGGSTTTNGFGVYTLANVSEGSYSLGATATGYNSSAPVAITVGPGATVTQSFSLAPLPGSIGGQVTDASTAAPIAGATVSFVVNGLTTSATTDGTGTYTLSNVTEATYSLAAAATGYSSLTRNVVVGPGQAVTQTNFALAVVPGSISGVITDASTAAPIAGATVSFVVTGVTTSATTDSTGTYTLANVRPGTYTVTAAAGGYGSQSQPVAVVTYTVSTQSFSLAPLPGSIGGQVTDASTAAPIAGATVSFVVNGLTTSATTDGTGTYTLSNVTEGTYNLTAAASGYSSLSRAVVVGPGQAVTQTNFALAVIPGSISGVVTDASTNKAIAAATVSFVVTGVTTSATTDSTGTYTLASVRPGTYTVTAATGGYGSQSQPVTVVTNTVSTQNFSLAPLPGSISGQVTDASTAAPIAGATVGYTVNGVTTSATTDGTGTYTLANVAAGTYTLTATAPNYTSGTPISVIVGPGATLTQNFSLGPVPGSITGQVTDASTTAPIAGATVSYTVNGVTTTATTDVTGTYTLSNVAEGTYSLTAAAGAYSNLSRTVVVGPGPAVTQTNFALVLLPGSISGVVTDASTGTPIQGATVSYPGGSTITSSSGYALANLSPGTYTVTAAAGGYGSQSQPVTVVTNSVSTQNFSLAPLPGTITGTVLDPITSKPIAGATVSYTVNGVTTSATTDGTGTYTLANVAEGTYSLTATAVNYTGSAPISVAVAPGATATQNFSLAPLPGSISGQVTDASTAAPIAGATVSYTVNGVTSGATTDSTGTYTLANVAEGTYNLTAVASGYRSLTGTVVVGPGQAVTLTNFALAVLPGSISGTVTDASTNLPVTGATVSYGGGSTTTNASGVYTLSNVVPGSYSVTASAGGYASQSQAVAVASNAVSAQNFSLAPLPGSIGGTVTDAVTAKAIANATVAFSGGSTTTNAAGVYTLSGVTEGSYSVTASAGSYSSQSQTVAVGPGATATQNFGLAPLPGSIGGTVLDSITSKPIVGATVSYTVNGVTTGATTDSTGSYTLANVAEGTYSLNASATGYTASVPVSVVVGPGATVTQGFSLSPSAAPPIFSDGFESGAFGAWDSSTGLVIESTTVHSGHNAAEGNTTTGSTYARKTLPSSYTNLYYRIYFYLKSHTGNVSLLWYRSASGAILHMYIDTSNNLGLRNDVASTATTSIPVTLNAWHSLEVHATISGTSSTLQVWLDGTHVTALESAAINLGTNAINQIQLGENNSGRIYDVVFDDVVLQASRIGP